MDGVSSDITGIQVTSGVPQGIVIYSLLFLHYINDITTAVTIKIRLFADDVVLYRKVYDHFDRFALEKDLAAINEWCSTWEL